MPRPKHAKRGGCLSRLIMFVILIVILVYPFYEAYNIKTEYVTQVFSDLPGDLNNIKIVYLSDIHMGSMFPMSRVKALVNKVNALNADFVILGGDYAEDSDGAIRFFEQAPQFRAKRMVFAVVGNHDRTIPESNLAVLVNAMRAANVMPLVNAVEYVPVGTTNIFFAGIDDINNGHPDIQGVASRVRASDFVVFLPHSPGAIPEALQATDQNGKSHWFDMALCGHTHGGQVTLLGRSLIPEFEKVNGRYQTGWITEHKAPILTSNGIGTAYLPIRLFAPPQIHVITLKGR